MLMCILCPFCMKRLSGGEVLMYSTLRSVQGQCRMDLASAASDADHTRQPVLPSVVQCICQIAARGGLLACAQEPCLLDVYG